MVSPLLAVVCFLSSDAAERGSTTPMTTTAATAPPTTPVFADAQAADDPWADALLSRKELVRDPTQHTWDAVVLPLVNANVDEGIAGGVLVAAHHYFGGAAPFHDDISMRLYLSSRLVQRHELRWEGLDVFGLPLRVRTRVGLYSTVTQTYCGVGNGVTCDEARARDAAGAAGLREGTEAFDDFVRRFYTVRFIRPHGDLTLRTALLDDDLRIEFLAGARLAYFLPGDFVDRGPSAGSLYARRFPDGEQGLSSVLQLGFTFDRRDFEPAPRRGFFVETSVRGGGPWTGSRWSVIGGNVSGALYVPLTKPAWSWPGLVLASRNIADVMAGDVPTDELAFIGGTRDDAAFGGQWIGRGVRDHRYVGKLKLIEQLELRTQWFGFSALWTRFDVGGAAFVDAAWIGADLHDVRGGSGLSSKDVGSPWRILYSGGVGLRIVVNRAFVVHVELAASPFEQIAPSFYMPTGSPF